jgi:hypothetical protein
VQGPVELSSGPDLRSVTEAVELVEHEPFELHFHTEAQPFVTTCRGLGEQVDTKAYTCSWPKATPQHVDLYPQRLCTCKVRQIENMPRHRIWNATLRIQNSVC